MASTRPYNGSSRPQRPFGEGSSKPTPIPLRDYSGERLVPHLMLTVRGLDQENPDDKGESIMARVAPTGDRILLGNPSERPIAALGTISAGSALLLPRTGELKPMPAEDQHLVTIEPWNITVAPTPKGLSVVELPGTPFDPVEGLVRQGPFPRNH